MHYIFNLSNNNEIPFGIEQLSKEQRFNEYIMTALRTIEGIDLDKIINYKDELIKQSQQFINRGWLVITSDKIILTKEGKLLRRWNCLLNCLWILIQDYATPLKPIRFLFFDASSFSSSVTFYLIMFQ